MGNGFNAFPIYRFNVLYIHFLYSHGILIPIFFTCPMGVYTGIVDIYM